MSNTKDKADHPKIEQEFTSLKEMYSPNPFLKYKQFNVRIPYPFKRFPRLLTLHLSLLFL